MLSEKISIVGMFIGKAYNNLYAFLNWYKNITAHLFLDVSRKIVVITDSDGIIKTQFSNCRYVKVETVNDSSLVKNNKFKYILDSTSDTELVAFVQSNMRFLSDANLSEMYDENDIVAIIHSSYSKDRHDQFFPITGSCSDVVAPVFPYVQTSFFIIKHSVLKDLNEKC